MGKFEILSSNYTVQLLTSNDNKVVRFLMQFRQFATVSNHILNRECDDIVAESAIV